MSAEEYLKKTVPSNYEWQEHHENTLVLEAMEQYSQHKADEQSLEFAKWLLKSDQMLRIGDYDWNDNKGVLARFKQEKQ